MHFLQLALCAITCLLFGAMLFGVDVQAVTNQAIVTTAETLAVVGNAVTLPTTTGKAVSTGWVQLNVSAATTAIVVTVYRGTAIGGTIVGQLNLAAGSFTAGQMTQFNVAFTDVLQNVSAAQYCMSIKCVGASGNSMIVNSALTTMVLSG